MGLVMIPFLCFYFLKGSEKKIALFENRTFRIILISVLFGLSLFVAKLPWIILAALAPFYIKQYILPSKTSQAPKEQGESYAGGFYNYYRGFLKFVLTQPKKALIGLAAIFMISLYVFGFVKVIFFKRTF